MLGPFIRCNRRSKKLFYRSIETGFLQVLRKFFRYFGCFQKGLFNIAASHMLLLITVMPRSKRDNVRSEEHTSELQSLMRISYAVFCLKKKNTVLRHNNK